MPLIPGDLIHERYRVDDLLAQGGMSAVYRVWDLRLQVAGALKEMVPYPGMDQRALNQLREQFLQEAQVLAELRHPNMPRVTDHFEWDGNAYLVMDYVEGQRLDEIIEDEGRVPVETIMNWARELVDALHYCHQHGVLHRDVKPQNVIITPVGAVMLVDFGLAKLLDIGDRHTRTVMRGLGTPEYAPPEQYDAEPGSTDERSDIYALGATLYHALAGIPPPTATQRIVDPGLLKPVNHYARDVPAHVDRTIVKSLALQPAQRFRTVPEMADALFGQPIVKPTSEPLGNGIRRRSDPLATVMLSHLRSWPRMRLWASAGGISLIALALFIALRGLAIGAPPVETPTSFWDVALLSRTATATQTPIPPTATQTPAPPTTTRTRALPTATRTSGPTTVTQTLVPTTATHTPTPTATGTASPTPTPCQDATLVRVSEPRGRGTFWLPNSPARLDVVLDNSGACAWPEDTRLALTSENLYGWPASWPVGLVEVGETVTVRVTLRAPGEEGTYLMRLQLELPDGQRIGPEITYSLLVKDATPTSTPTPTRPTFTPTLTATPGPGGPSRPPTATPTIIAPEPTTPAPSPTTPPPPTFTPRPPPRVTP